MKDGRHVPVGTQIAWPGPQHAFNSQITPEPQKFDPMRSYRKRHTANQDNLNRFLAGQSDPHNMWFGYGGQVCPGRYFAVSEIKLMLMPLPREFDFTSVPGKERPKPIYADENVILDPYAKVMMRRRELEECE